MLRRWRCRARMRRPFVEGRRTFKIDEEATQGCGEVVPLAADYFAAHRDTSMYSNAWARPTPRFAVGTQAASNCGRRGIGHSTVLQGIGYALERAMGIEPT